MRGSTLANRSAPKLGIVMTLELKKTLVQVFEVNRLKILWHRYSEWKDVKETLHP
jgi:hypothetical protein